MGALAGELLRQRPGVELRAWVGAWAAARVELLVDAGRTEE